MSNSEQDPFKPQQPELDNQLPLFDEANQDATPVDQPAADIPHEAEQHDEVPQPDTPAESDTSAPETKPFVLASEPSNGGNQPDKERVKSLNKALAIGTGVAILATAAGIGSAMGGSSPKPKEKTPPTASAGRIPGANYGTTDEQSTPTPEATPTASPTDIPTTGAVYPTSPEGTATATDSTQPETPEATIIPTPDVLPGQFVSWEDHQDVKDAARVFVGLIDQYITTQDPRIRKTMSAGYDIFAESDYYNFLVSDTADAKNREFYLLRKQQEQEFPNDTPLAMHTEMSNIKEGPAWPYDDFPHDMHGTEFWITFDSRPTNNLSQTAFGAAHPNLITEYGDPGKKQHVRMRLLTLDKDANKYILLDLLDWHDDTSN